MCNHHSYSLSYSSFQIYRELAEQKREKAVRDSVNNPKERNAEKEQAASIEAIRVKEESCEERCQIVLNMLLTFFYLLRTQ